MDYQELQDLVQSHEDSITEINDSAQQAADDFQSYADNNDSNVQDLQNDQGQLTFPLSQDTIDLIKEQIPVVVLPYGGSVDSTCASPVLPAGWTAAVDGGTNIYTITHNLGTTAYSVVCNTNSFSLVPVLQSVNANTFTIDFENNSSGLAFAVNWTFVLIPIT